MRAIFRCIQLDFGPLGKPPGNGRFQEPARASLVLQGLHLKCPQIAASLPLGLIARSSELLWVDVVINDCPDAADNKFLELAVSSGASVIVSGDPHLRNMHPFRGITIATPAEFLVLGTQGS